MTETAVETSDAVLEALTNRITTVRSRNNHLKMLIIGDPGSGKTTFAAGAPNNLIVDIEKGTAVLMGTEYEETPVLEYKSFKQLEMLTQKLGEGAFPEIETITIDSLSELTKRGLEELTEKRYQDSGGMSNRFVPETDDYTQNNEHIRRIVSALRDLERNIICISHVREQADKRSGLTIKRADFSERLAGTMAGIFDIVGYLRYDAETGDRSLQIQPTSDVMVKTRVSGLPPVVPNPTWDTFYEAFKAQRHIGD